MFSLGEIYWPTANWQNIKVISLLLRMWRVQINTVSLYIILHMYT